MTEIDVQPPVYFMPATPIVLPWVYDLALLITLLSIAGIEQ
ncbi:hypothetical protein swp_4987 [Shewanella piezotolerans WP3]|uniref:Uncharacterized protein n=1 Tax=Shewanella piezotolerans (strain WP3 / JCM 13877) TaxID=225849 RepID=B8CVC7_SHEPW|nr:hypothetical protein swp_4987 [Shewanella piezotolerans WP3]